VVQEHITAATAAMVLIQQFQAVQQQVLVNYQAVTIILLVAVVVLVVGLHKIKELADLVAVEMVEEIQFIMALMLTLIQVAEEAVEQEVILETQLVVQAVAVLLFSEFLEMLLPQQQLVLQQGIQVEDTPIMYLLEQGV
jgi:hypothetical protein